MNLKIASALGATMLLAGCISFGGKPPESLLSLTPTATVPAGTAINGDVANAIAVVEPDAERPERDERVIHDIRGLVGRSIARLIGAREHELRRFFSELLESKIAVAEETVRVALCIGRSRTLADRSIQLVENVLE